MLHLPGKLSNLPAIATGHPQKHGRSKEDDAPNESRAERRRVCRCFPKTFQRPALREEGMQIE